MIRIDRLTFRHQPSSAPIVEEISFGVSHGRTAVLLGPNGSGKTTLFKCIAGLWRPSVGSILFDGRDMQTMSHRERARILAVVPQDHTPPFPYSVLEAVVMGRAPHVGTYGAPSAADLAIAGEALAVVGISHLAKRPYTRISGGERQLALIARALTQEAPLLLLDEPTSHLDFRNQHLVLDTVRRIANDKGLTVLMTLHDPNLAARFANHVIMLRDGAIQAEGPPEEVISEENLSRLYQIPVGLIAVDGQRLLYPRLT